MKIALLTDKVAPFYSGGYENRLYQLARKLSVTNEVTIFTSLKSENIHADGLEFRKISTTAFQEYGTYNRNILHSALFFVSFALNRKQLKDYDIVIIEAIPYLHLLSMSKRIRKIGVQVSLDVMEAWCCYRNYEGIMGTVASKLISALLLRGIRFSDFVISLSQVTKRSLIENFGMEEREVILVPGGINLKAIWTSLEGKFYEENPERYDIVSVSRLVKIKRLDDLILAIGKLKDRFQWKGKVAIIGDGPEKKNLNYLINALELTGCVKLLGFLPEEGFWDNIISGIVLCNPLSFQGLYASGSCIASGCAC